MAVFAEFEVNGRTAGLLCGGSIIDTSHIVTAGHCAFNPATGQPLPASSFVVLAGASSITVEEIENSPTVEGRFVAGARIHPDFQYAAGPGTSDDVAVLQLKSPLQTSSSVRTIALPSSASNLPEGTNGLLSGFGEENPVTEELNEKLYSLPITLGSSRKCGGEAGAVFLCGSNTGGSACSGDSGGGLVHQLGGERTLIGVIDTVQIVAGERCTHGAMDGFVNLQAPEIRDFVEGSESPPLAPRGGGIAIRGILTVGHTLTCEPGSWSSAPTFIYSFIDSAHGQILQQGSSSTYLLSEADVGRTILCQVQATNSGGTGIVSTTALSPVEALPVVPPPPPPGGGSTPPGSGGGSGPAPGGEPPRGGAPAPGGATGPGNGGVLGYTNANVSAAQIAALLGHELMPAGKSAKVAAVLKAGGFTIAFKALEAGTAVIYWYQLPPGAKLSRKSKAKPILVASGQVRFSAAGTASIRLRLTGAGKQLLKGRKGLRLTARGTFTPAGMAPVTATEAFALKR